MRSVPTSELDGWTRRPTAAYNVDMRVRLVTHAGVRTVHVVDGATLLLAVLRARLPIGRSCRGKGVCAACRVRMLDGSEHLRAMDTTERSLCARNPLGPDERYACRARADGDVSFTTSYW